MSSPAIWPDPAGRQDLSSLFDFLPIGAYRSLPDGRMERANPALVRLNGYDSEAEMLVGVQNISSECYVDPSRRQAFRELLEQQGQVLAFVSEAYRHRTRERIWISENAHLVRDASGQVLFYEGTIEEITDRVRAEQALRDNEQRWKLALESAGDGVWDWNLARNEEIVSPRLLQMYGLREGDHGGRPEALDARTHPDDRAEMARARQAHWDGRTPVYINEHRVRCANGRWKWVLSRGMVIERDTAGRPLRMIGTHTDIDERKEAESLRRERDHSAAAQKAQTAFLSRVSHELRTPMNAIIGFAQLLQLEDQANERQRLWVNTILDSGRHLLALVNDLLDLSSAQTGQLQFTCIALPLAPLLADVRAMHDGEARKAGVHLVERIEPAGLAVQADPTRLKQVLSNLLSNAIKYNRTGGQVALSAQPLGDRVELSVSDQGIGMDEAQQARLFNPFERLGAQHSPVAGTGLGLALAKQLTESMGGSMTVQSTPGQGSTFSVLLPIVPSRARS